MARPKALEIHCEAKKNNYDHLFASYFISFRLITDGFASQIFKNMARLPPHFFFARKFKTKFLFDFDDESVRNEFRRKNQTTMII